MFQRLRDAIDSRIAEEQARQKSAQDNIERSNSARRPPGRNQSPNRRSRPRRNTGTPIRGPDPKEFEAEFTIGDDESSRSGTPQADIPEGAPEVNTSNEGESEMVEGKPAETPENETGQETMAVLSPEVRAKLRRLDKLESRYHELLKAYRTAHSRVLSIEPFEATLRENTPLTSIAEPKAFTEYLNQSTLKSDMVMEELKRVTEEREEFRKKFEVAQQAAKEALDEVTGLKNEKPQTATTKGTDGTGEQAGEEFFSFDNEVPRLEGELKEKQEEVESLKIEVEKLKRDMSVTRESTESLVQNLETASRELVELRETKDNLDAEIKTLQTSKKADIDDLKAKLTTAESSLKSTTSEVEKLNSQLKEKTEEIDQLQKQASERTESDSDLAAELEMTKEEKKSDEKKLVVLQGLVDGLRSQLKDTESTILELKTEIEERCEHSAKLQDIYEFVNENLKENRAWVSAREKVFAGELADFNEVAKTLAAVDEKPTSTVPAPAPAPAQGETQPAQATGGGGSGGKKKNKKKKKSGKAEEPIKPADAAPAELSPTEAPAPATKELDELKEKIETLTQQLYEKQAAIDRLSSKLKGEDNLKEEIESLRDDLVNIGQEHVAAKDKIKELSAEKTSLEETIGKLEKELVDLRTSSALTSADSEKAHASLKEEFDNLKVRSVALETDISAAQQLAATRFKDLTDLRETLQKVQPELRSLRAESSELKTLKETLTSKNSDLKALEGKHEDLRAELKTFKSKVSERDAEVGALNKKIRQETDSRMKAEEYLSVTQSNLRSAESKRQDAINARDKTAGDLSKAQDGLKNARIKMREMDEQISQLNKELASLRDEIQLKTAQHSSAQGLLNSMCDQTTEVAMQMKEARERCESLDEELADAHRLLSERTREGETMRRLLNDIEGRSESKVRDFKERMEAAIEERDRAEDEASTQGRRRAREMEELKGKVREAERALRTAEQDKEELEQSQKDWRRRRDELELLSEKSSREVTEVRQAMAGLRDALDASEKQVRDLEKDKAELRRSVEETNNRLEKLRKSHKTLGEDVRLRGSPSGRQSSRSSMDSGSRRAAASPGKSETPLGPPSNASIDFMYLKNVLLQFLEQRDKNYQKQLIPVLGMLLHFDRIDVPLILQFICELADYEKALHEVEATEESLLATLSFPDTPPKRGAVYTALITPPHTADTPNPIPVGMALYFYNYSTWRSAPGIYLEDLYVQPNARGHGYGFKLLKYLAKQVLKVSGRRLEWSVLTWNEPSIKFYEQVGARGMDEWMKMMVEGDALTRLAEGA
ncbi:Vesicle-mediated transport protein (Imh1), putative [Penicillium digitatum PHI26]|uniref:Vesicle-mediated transport protein (Imh1), putative n=1 Tax=Penicillium digitatum (strain PHI26 / CECT 20796) TaxID=1170229 RepID=K9G5G8_PEND2|nr:Vesicle-mediated transport protein (Imh1), putative [Penicillium digitatum PHI26]